MANIRLSMMAGLASGIILAFPLLAHAENSSPALEACQAAYQQPASGAAKTIDYAETFKNCLQAAEQGFAEAQTLLGAMYAAGRGVAKNDAEAVKWYRLAAEQGYARAQYILSQLYGTGRGVAKDEAESAKWLRLAAEQGYAKAQLELGMKYTSGIDIRQDNEAEKMLGLAAKLGLARDIPEAKNDKQFTKDYDESVKSLKLAAEQRAARAKGGGNTQNGAEAEKWFRLAAEQGNVEAQIYLARMYAEGFGVALNETEAVKWYRLAAEQGNGWAQYFLGTMYAEGRGVAQNTDEAVKWLTLSGNQGHQYAQGILMAIGKAPAGGFKVAPDFR